MPRKGKNIKKSEIFFSFQFNDKTDTTCRCSKKRHRTGVCLQFLHFLFLSYTVTHILSCMLSCIMCFITVYIATLPRFSPISVDRFRFCAFALRGVQKNVRAGVSTPAHLPPRPGDDSGTIRRRCTASPSFPLFPDRRTDPKSSAEFFLRG